MYLASVHVIHYRGIHVNREPTSSDRPSGSSSFMNVFNTKERAQDWVESIKEHVEEIRNEAGNCYKIRLSHKLEVIR